VVVHFGDYTEALGFLSAEKIAGPEQFQGFGETHQAWQQKGAAVPRYEAYFNIAFGKAGTAGGETYVRHQCHVQPGSRGGAVQGANVRLLQGIDGPGDGGHVLTDVFPHVPGWIAVMPAHRPQVATGTKDPTSRCQHHPINGVVRLAVAQGPGPVRQHASVKGVELGGTIQSDGGDLVRVGKQQLIGHNSLTPGYKLCVVRGLHYSALAMMGLYWRGGNRRQEILQ